MAHQTTDETPEASADPRLLTYMQTRLKHADPWAVAAAVLERLARRAFDHAGAGDIESVKIEAADGLLAITGRETAVREVTKFINGMDATAAEADKKEEANEDTDDGWTDDPDTYTAPPLSGIEDLYGDFWPEDESVDDFIDMVRELRSRGGAREIE